MEFAFAGRLLAACVVIAGVLACLRLATGRLATARRVGGRARLLAILETVPLPGAASLHIVRAGDRYFAIGRDQGAIATLCEIPAECAEASLPAGPLRPLPAATALATFARRFRARPSAPGR